MIKSLPSKIGEAFEEFGRYIKGKLKEFFTFNFNFGDVGKKVGAGVSAWQKGAADPSGQFDMNVPGSAAGRKTAGPMLSLIGEGAAPEYVIPTESRYRERALALWQQAGKDLGVPMMASGGFFNMKPDPDDNDYLNTAQGNLGGISPNSIYRQSQLLKPFFAWLDSEQTYRRILNSLTMFAVKSNLLQYSAMTTPLGAANNDFFIKFSSNLATLVLNHGKSLLDYFKSTFKSGNDKPVHNQGVDKPVSFAPVFNITVTGSTSSVIGEDIKRACRDACDEMKNDLQRTAFLDYAIMSS